MLALGNRRTSRGNGSPGPDSAAVSALGDQIRQPSGLIGRTGALAVSVFAHVVTGVPVYVDLGKTCLEQQFLQLGHGPEAPVVAECLGQLGAVIELEMDVVGDVVGDGVERVLIPHIRE